MNLLRGLLSCCVLFAILTACKSQVAEGPGPLDSRETAGQAPCRVIEQGYGPKGQSLVRLEKVVSGLEVPWGIAFLPSGDWLVTERPGRVRLVRSGVLQPNPVVTIPVGEEGEGGLLGIAAHPNFATNRYFYVYYTHTTSTGNVNRVERYQLSEEGTSAVSQQIIVDQIPAGTFHNGGSIKFGPDGMLYIATGDGRIPDLSQDEASPRSCSRSELEI